MGTDTITCPSCGAQGSATDKFCGSCGNMVSTAAKSAAQPPAASNRKATMLGMTSVAPPGEQPAAPASKPPSSGRKATMLGMSSVPPPGAPAPAQAATPSSPGHDPQDPALQRTVLGMQSPAAGGQPPAPSEPVPSSTPDSEQPGGGKTVFGVDASGSSPPRDARGAPPASPKGTMLGMQSPLASGAGGGGAAGTSAATPSASSGTPEATRQTAASAKGRTMLGMQSPLSGAPATQAAQGAAPGPAKPARDDAKSNRTMLGMVQPAAEPPAAEPAARPPRQSPPADDPSLNQRFTPPADAPSFSKPRGTAHSVSDSGPGASLTAAGGKRSMGASLWLGVAALLCAALAVAAVLLSSGGPEVSAEVTAGKRGDVLRVRVPEAEPGTKVRFGGNEAELHAGMAEFPLAADSLKVGSNQVSLDVVDPDGDVDSVALELTVDYRARLDLAGLEGEQPSVAVVVDAVPGSDVWLAGDAVQLDASGRATVTYPVKDSTGSRFDLEVPYRIEPPQGPAVEGKLELHLPVVSMQIDRPGEEVFTDADHIEIGGAVEQGANVRVAGKPVEVNDGRFLYSQQLGKPGEYRFSVVARAKGKAPSAREVRVTRVEDMAIAAAAFEFDPALSYARIAQNPAIYRGQRVAFDGRVYNVEVEGGRSVLQMLVRDCPRGHKCQLWVDYAQATDVTVGSMVRVLGVVSGEQQYRSKKGGVQTAPSVSARFILPLVK